MKSGLEAEQDNSLIELSNGTFKGSIKAIAEMNNTNPTKIHIGANLAFLSSIKLIKQLDI